MINKKKDIDFSIVTIVNKLEVFDDFCKSVEKQQDVSFELIPIYNLKNEYRFETSKELYTTKLFLEETTNFGVIGVAGASGEKNNTNKRVIYSNLTHGVNKKDAGVKIDALQEVQTVDECFFVVKKNYIINKKFSNLEGWHLYAVELCLQCILENKKNYVIPLNIWHLSDGKSLDSNYIYQLNKIIQIYGNEFPILYTTVKLWKTKGLKPRIYRHYYLIKQKIKRKVLR